VIVRHRRRGDVPDERDARLLQSVKLIDEIIDALDIGKLPLALAVAWQADGEAAWRASLRPAGMLVLLARADRVAAVRAACAVARCAIARCSEDMRAAESSLVVAEAWCRGEASTDEVSKDVCDTIRSFRWSNHTFRVHMAHWSAVSAAALVYDLDRAAYVAQSASSSLTACQIPVWKINMEIAGAIRAAATCPTVAELAERP